jgi:hypothetical protein
MTVLIGLFTLPFLLWSWLLDKNEEDGELAISLISWIVIGVVATWVAAWALGLRLWP